MRGAFVGKHFPEEVMIAEQLAVIGGEDNPGRLIRTRDAVVEDPTEHEGDRVIDVIHQTVVTRHRIPHRFEAEGADVGLGLQARSRWL